MFQEIDVVPPPALFRFGQQRYLDQFLHEGIVSMAIGTTYLDSALTQGQQDNEIVRQFTMSPSLHDIEVKTERETAKLTEDEALNLRLHLVGRDRNPLKYYMWCTSLEFSEKLADEFNANSCIRISDPLIFGERLLAEARRKFPSRSLGIPGCDLYGRNVHYYNPAFPPQTRNQVELVFMKPNHYIHQKEFRTIFATDPEFDLPNRIEFKLGRLTDIAEIYEG